MLLYNSERTHVLTHQSAPPNTHNTTYTIKNMLTRICATPALFLADDVIPDALRVALLAMGDQRDALTARGVEVHHGHVTGTSFEPARGQHPDADALLDHLGALLSLPPRPDDSLRWRRYEDAQSHPPHLDTYAMGERRLVATALVCLEAPAHGGQTFFPCAHPDPIALSMRPARLILWLNERAHATPDPASLHAGLAVQGVKTTATWFIYLDQAEADALRERLSALPDATHAQGVGRDAPRLHYIGAAGAPETGRALRDACATRGVGFVELDPRRADLMAVAPLPPGDLLYRAGGSALAQRLEALLIAPGTGHLYAEDDGPLRTVWQDIALQRAGLPLPRRATLVDADPDALALLARRMGGYPLVLRFPGGSGGVGVVRVDSQPALCSLAEWACQEGHQPELMAYIPDAVHWRAIVVGDQVVATYLNPTRDGDFRSYAGEEPDLYTKEPPAGLASLAVRATHTLALRFGGVDILVHPTGRMYLLEVNFPCYFGHAQQAGQDVAGAMIDAMLARARR